VPKDALITLSVVVATFNRREMLSKCLRALKAQDFPRSRFEVIVVVDGSTDGTEDFLKDCDFGPRLQVLVQENRGLAAARNAGLQAAKQEVVLFLDDDLLCAPNVLSEHAPRMRVSPGLSHSGPSWFLQMRREMWQLRPPVVTMPKLSMGR